MSELKIPGCAAYLVALALLLGGCERESAAPEATVAPPDAMQRASVQERFGIVRDDPYAWMAGPAFQRERDDYIRAENQYADAMLAHTDALQRTLMAEFNERLPRHRTSPVHRSGYGAYWREVRSGSQYPVFLREGYAGLNGVILDVNELASSHGYFDLGDLSVSPDGDRILYTQDVTGDQRYEVRLRQIGGKDAGHATVAKGAGPAVAWESDDSFLYVRDNALYRGWRGKERAQRLYVEEVPGFTLQLHSSGGTPYLVSEGLVSEGLVSEGLVSEGLASERGRTNVIRLVRENRVTPVTQLREGQLSRLAIGAPPADMAQTQKRADQARVAHLLQVGPGLGYSLYRFNLSDAGHRQAWVQLRSVGDHETDDWQVVAFEPLGERVAVLERRRMAHRILVVGRQRVVATMQLRDETAHVRLTANGEDGVVRFIVSNLVSPPVTHGLHIAEGIVSPPLHAASTSPAYRVRRLWVDSTGETSSPVQVPVTIAYKMGAPLDQRPLLVTAYGAYGIDAPLGYLSHRLSLLERGVIFAVIHVRGGGELGPAWHRAGRSVQRRNAVTDLVAGTRTLLELGYGDANKVIARGASAGGTLMGALVNEHPEMFRAVVAVRPFVDLVNTLESSDAADRLEWGDPSVARDYRFLHAFSPYEQVRAHDNAQPSLYITGAVYDSRVGVHEPLKWVAKLRDHRQGGGPLVLRIEAAEGHKGATDQYDRHLAQAREYAFMLAEVGILD